MTEIKICGITNLEDASIAAACGVNALGFIFYEKSPRHVTPEKAREIIKRLPDEITKVGVFVNHDAQQVQRTVEFCGLDLVQLHGDESPEYCLQFPSFRLIKGIAPRGKDDLRRMRSYQVRAILVDAYDPLRRGGTGRRSDWGLALKVKETHPLILAGGLSIDTIQEAIDTVAPDAVDVNSGVESAPGKKDHHKVKAIIDLIRQLGGEGKKIFGR